MFCGRHDWHFQASGFQWNSCKCASSVHVLWKNNSQDEQSIAGISGLITSLHTWHSRPGTWVISMWCLNTISSFVVKLHWSQLNHSCAVCCLSVCSFGSSSPGKIISHDKQDKRDLSWFLMCSSWMWTLKAACDVEVNLHRLQMYLELCVFRCTFKSKELFVR